MFYKMIADKQKSWYKSADCTVLELIDYISQKGFMRDAQIEAIKTYLYLKIACNNKPLNQLFSEGFFNTLDLDETELRNSTKEYLKQNPDTTALFEYASLTDESGSMLSRGLVDLIKTSPEEIDYKRVFKDIFYNCDYTDYLFSLPMGAGKTYLMAAFIYLDLYFATNEPTNPAFAHNFIVFAPSGLKTSVVPSLRTIQDFDPSWIIPEPSATNIKNMLKFEVLDQKKTENKSNKTKNPNVQKIAIHQPLHELFGLVAVTNAEKVILDRIKETNGQIDLLEQSADEKDRQANELRNLLGKLPNLSVFIDEVHHAQKDEVKLRSVVTKWAENKTMNSVIGFSGTPYLAKKEKIDVADTLTLASVEISNIVYYYPLIKGIGNFLKRPTVKISTSKSRLDIVEAGVKEFLDLYKDTVYHDGTCAKLGIYCGTIETLEEQIFPLVSRLLSKYGLNAQEAILKFHGGNKTYSIPVDSQLQFDILDETYSKIRIVLLVQIGKEGWDCHSLTGIILSQEGDCPTNMVLQTSCRCLRQVKRHAIESALIYLNEKNSEILNNQLKQQHHISMEEFQKGNGQNTTTIRRYDRTEYLKLPKVDFYQLSVRYDTLVIDNTLYTERDISNSYLNSEKNTITKTAEFGSELIINEIDPDYIGNGNKIANFNCWLYEIAKGSFGFISMIDLKKYSKQLEKVFSKITFERKENIFFKENYNLVEINENIRKAFYEKRTFETIEELIPEKASLLRLDNFTKQVETQNVNDYYPNAQITENIVKEDNGESLLDKETEDLIKQLECSGRMSMAETLKAEVKSHPLKDKSFHYLPYKTDSEFERTFLKDFLTQKSIIENKNLEIYYNGDRSLTEFKIKCYKKDGKSFRYIGMYTPDFLIVNRKDGEIHKIVIVETKGKIYANDPTFVEKRNFMEKVFSQKNNKEFGYNRFEYLYLEDTLTEAERITKTAEVLEVFFEGEIP